MKLESLITVLAGAAAIAMVSCNDRETYAELLVSEDHATNNFLADQIVINSIPADTVFVTVAEAGDDAPYYRLDEDGMLYMQVVNAGTPGNKATADELIYFRYSRYNLRYYENGTLHYSGGNEDDMTQSSTSFRFGNYTLSSSSQWGTGIQQPLLYLPVDCQVNLVVKSQLGFTSEIASVVPFLYKLRYYRPKI